jgi:hypothetical protein
VRQSQGIGQSVHKSVNVGEKSMDSTWKLNSGPSDSLSESCSDVELEFNFSSSLSFAPGNNQQRVYVSGNSNIPRGRGESLPLVARESL